MKAGFALLGLIWLAGCAAEAPFRVEQPLSRARALSDDAQPPSVVPAPPHLPRITEAQLANGMSLQLVERAGSGFVNVVLVAPRARLGTDYAPVFVGDALLAGVDAEDGKLLYPVMLDGLLPRVVTGFGGTTVSLACRAEHFEQALRLLSAVVQRPHFDARRLEPIRQRTALDLLGIGGQYWEWELASSHRGEPFEVDEEDVAERLQSLDGEQLRRLHRQLFGPSDASLVVVGDVSAERVRRGFEQHFSHWQEGARAEAAPEPVPKAAVPPTPPNRKVIVFDQPTYPSVMLIQDAPALDAPDALPFELLTELLGSLSSPIMQALRFESTHLYAVGARQVTVPGRGRYLFLQTDTASENLVADLSAMLGKLDQLGSKPLAERELFGAKAELGTDMAGRLASGAGIAGYLASLQLRDELPLQDLDRRLSTVSAEDVQRVAQRYLDPTRATIVVQGKLSREALEGLRAFGAVETR